MGVAGDLTDTLWRGGAFVEKHYYSVKGLVAQLILASFIVGASVSRVLTFFGVNSADSVGKGLTRIREALVYTLAWLFAAALVVFVWLLRRRVPHFKEGRTGILFTARTEPELEADLRNLEERLREEISQKDICQNIDVKILPPNYWVKGPADAVAFLRRSGGRVLIWGRFEKNTRDGREITGFSSISFTANSLPMVAAQNAEVIGDSLVGKQWGWDAADSIHKSVVSQNLSEVARYIIGLSLLARGHLADAEQVLGILLADVETKYRSKRVPPPVHRFQGTLKRAYLESIVHGITVAYRQELNDERLFELDESTWSQWSDRLSFVIQRDENTRGVRLLLAIVRFMQRNVTEAKRLLREEAQKFPRSRTACLFSEAFLASFEGNYGDARKLYRDLLRDPKTAEADVLSVLLFLEAAAGHYSERPGLLFLVGLMNDELYDKARALTAFDEFIRRCYDRPELVRWVREAKIRLRRIEESDTNGPGSG